MKFCEIWKDFVAGKWIQRSAWKRDYAISLCNLKSEPNIPILMRDTKGYLWDFLTNQGPRQLKKPPGGKYNWVHGLQYSLLADDWKVADQTKCDMTLAEHEK